jgi:hypothetical protein
MTASTRAFVVAGAIIWITVAACDKSSRPAPAAPSTPTPVITTDFRIEGPTSLAPGETAQFKVMALQSDGSTRDVTSETSWRSSHPAVLQMTADGIATGVAPGTAHAVASVGGRTWGQWVDVLPRGTYRLAGRVVEHGLPIAEAAVSVIAGPAAGLSARSDGSGRYALYGVVDDIQVRASKEDYQSQVQHILVTANQTLDFELAPVVRVDLSDNYLLRITAADCKPYRLSGHVGPGVLPEEAKDRTYRASVTQDGPRVSVTLSGANLFGTSRFEGRVFPDSVSFTLGGPGFDPYYYYYGRITPDLGERLSGSRFMITSGSVNAKRTTTGIAGVLNGLLRVGEGPNPPLGTRIADCFSNEHQFVMTK